MNPGAVPNAYVFVPATSRNTDTFGYNTRSEVTAASILSNAYTYAYDFIGNHTTSTVDRVRTTYSANTLNQYTAILCAPAPLREPSYDLDGNMLTNGVWSYTYDAENRLVAAYSNSVCVVSNAYDHASRRVARWTPSHTTTYVYDGWNLVMEIQSSTIPVFQSSTNLYVWGKDLSGSRQGAGGVGGLLAFRQGNAWYFPLTDANGNITAYINEQGSVVAEYTYDAFGATIASSGPMTAQLRFRFSTKYYDPELSLYYYGYRFYSPDIRRWLNRDPIEEDGGLNLYAFCGNDGVNGWDVFGLRVYWPYVGVPTEPMVNFDSDYDSPFPDIPTAEDKKHWDALGKLIPIAEKVMPDAMRAFRHYRSGDGTDLTVDYEKAYRDDSVIRNEIDDAIYEAAREAERLLAHVKKGGSSGWCMSSNAEPTGQPATQNWQKTLGNHNVWGSAEVKLCNEKYKMWLTLHAIDRYNFNKGDKDIATGIPDDILRRFAQVDWAKGFVTRGTIDRIVSWERRRPYQLTIEKEEGVKP